MKKLWPCLMAVLVLSACTSVDDFSLYWDKGVVDPALEGTWQMVGLPGLPAEEIGSIAAPTWWRFTKSGSSYLEQGINPVDPTADPKAIAQRIADNESHMLARTLRIGRHHLLMQRDPRGGRGALTRYEIQGATLREYWIANGAAVDFLKTKHPEASNIKKNVGEGSYVVIETFDDEVFQVLSEMVDNPIYWRLNCEYKKVPRTH
jgi:hypothetical protein